MVNQTKIQQRNNFLLGFWFQVNQQIPAGRHIQFSKRSVLKNIMRCKHNLFSQFTTDEESVFDWSEVFFNPLRINIDQAVFRVDSPACKLNTLRVDIRGKNFDIEFIVAVLHQLIDHDRN